MNCRRKGCVGFPPIILISLYSYYYMLVILINTVHACEVNVGYEITHVTLNE